MSSETTHQQNPEVAGNPALWQVRDFVADAPAAPSNPLLPVFRAFRGIWVFAVVAAAVVGLLLAFTVFNMASPSFESEGLVRVVARQPKILYADNDDSRLRLYDAFVSAEVTYLMSQPVLERAYDIMTEQALSRDPNAQLPTVKEFSDTLAVKKLKGLIAIAAKSRDAAVAQRSVNALLDSYVALHTEQSGTRKSLRARELEVRERMLQEKQYELARQILEIGEEYDASSLAKAHLTKVTQLEELDIRIDELKNSLMEMESSDGALDADTGDMEIKRATMLDRAMADMVFERAKRAAELEKLLLRYQPVHPKVQTATASLAVIDEAIESRRRLIATLGKTGAITGGDGADKKQSLAELEALKRKLSNRRNELSDEAKRLNGKLISLRRINDEKSQIAGMLAETRRILDQVNLENRTNLPGTIEILSRGSLPLQASEDKRKQFAALALIAGGGLVIVVIFLMRHFSDRIRYSDDLEASPMSVGSAVMEDGAENEPLRHFLSDLQLSDTWSKDTATVVSFVRFSDDTSVPLSELAELAASQGLRTLLVTAAEDAGYGDAGFIETLEEDTQVKPTRIGTFDYLPFSNKPQPANYSIQTAKAWMRNWAPKYDLIMIYSGVAERHLSTRQIPKLSHVSVQVVAPGDSKRKVHRTVSQTDAPATLFVGAQRNDPGLQEKEHTIPIIKGEENVQAA